MGSGFIFDQGNLNTSALTVPGAYVALVPPTGLLLPGPSNAVFFAGTASWGPVNQACGPFGTIDAASSVHGQFRASLWRDDSYDLMRGIMQALGEVQTTQSLNIWTTRISDGDDEAASATLVDITDGSPLDGITLPAKWTGIDGNSIKAIISAGSGAHTFNVTFVASIGGQTVSETYVNLAGSESGASPFWANLNNAILHGTTSRGPSKLIGEPTDVSTTALNPKLDTFTLSGGTDGRSGVDSSSFFGSDVIGNREGVYCSRGLPIVPAYFYCCGLIDTSKVGLLASLCLSEVMRYIFPLEAGTSTLDAVDSRLDLGISDKRFMYAKDYIYWVDPISGETLFTDPVALMIGRAASLSPELSPLNKPILTVIGSEHPRQYPADEIGLLNQYGIWVITNPCLGSPFWGIASASTTSLNPIEQPVEYERLKDYIGITFASALGKFVGQKQGPYDPDATRSACKSDIDSAMQQLVNGGLLVDWQSQVDAKLNSPQSVQAGYMRGNLTYVPFTNIKFVILNLATSASLSAGQAFARNQQGG